MAQIEEKQGKDGGKVRVKKASTKVDMAPLCDLGFLLITFFMFTTTFSTPNFMNLNMPPKDNRPKNEKNVEIDVSNSISIVLGKDNKIFWHQQDNTTLNPSNLNETNYSADGIRKVIQEAKSRAKDKDKFTVVIKPTDDSNYENLVDVLDEMAITKSERYGIVQIQPWELKVYDEKVGK